MRIALCLVSLLLVSCSKLEDASLFPAYVPVALEESVPRQALAENPNNNLLFGDLHIHTSLSTDAYVFGVRSLPEDVYVFAKGGTIKHGAGYPIRISRPLDFAAVTDHAEFLGQARLANLDVPTNRRALRDLLLNGNALEITLAWIKSTGFIKNKGFGFGIDKVDDVVNKAAWKMTIDAAQKHNEPGVFTTFIAYEWSAYVDDSTVHVHRNVIYRDDQVSEKPFSYLDSQRPEELWRFLEKEGQAGRHAFAIPHNANLSNGNMYRKVDSDGGPITAEYARMRSRYEPISEILQIKGASETHPLLSSLDEFANFELASLGLGGGDASSVKGSYARDALRLGLELSHREGFNPYDFGVIGSSDSHNASSPSRESSYHGKLPMMDGGAGLRTSKATLLPASLNPVTRWGSGGLAGVWAKSNTRASIYDALLRKETFATSGPRISVRFFAGWGFEKAVLSAQDPISIAYEHGIPMGGKLISGPAGVSPSFFVMAMKDPEGANLDRVQIIKAWVDAEGNSDEKVFDVVVSDQRRIGVPANRTPPVGNTVNVDTAEYTNSIGDPSLMTVWTDPEFDPLQRAFYYARVIEIPTPRWSTFDAITLGVEPMNPTSIQERAITSAIWYSPDH